MKEWKCSLFWGKSRQREGGEQSEGTCVEEEKPRKCCSIHGPPKDMLLRNLIPDPGIVPSLLSLATIENLGFSLGSSSRRWNIFYGVLASLPVPWHKAAKSVAWDFSPSYPECHNHAYTEGHGRQHHLLLPGSEGRSGNFGLMSIGQLSATTWEEIWHLPRYPIRSASCCTSLLQRHQRPAFSFSEKGQDFIYPLSLLWLIPCYLLFENWEFNMNWELNMRILVHMMRLIPNV